MARADTELLDFLERAPSMRSKIYRGMMSAGWYVELPGIFNGPPAYGSSLRRAIEAAMDREKRDG